MSSVTTTMTAVPLPVSSGAELTASPNNTGAPSLNNTLVPVIGLYNPYDPTSILVPLPIASGLLEVPMIQTLTGTGSGTTNTYQVAAFRSGVDGPLSVGVNGSFTSTTINWGSVPGADGYKVIRSNLIIATVWGAGNTSFTDSGAAGSAYTPQTIQPVAPVHIVSDALLSFTKPTLLSLVANTAGSIAIPNGVKAVTIVNGTSSWVYRDYGTTATAGSFPIQPNGGVLCDKGALGGLTLSLVSTVAATVNGTTAGNVVVEFWL